MFNWFKSKKMEKKISQLEQKYQQLEERYNSKEQELTHKYDKLIDKLEQKHNNKINKLDKEYNAKEQQYQKKEQQHKDNIDKLQGTIEDLQVTIEGFKKDLQVTIEELEKEEFVLDTGSYICKYDLGESSKYKEEIAKVKQMQKDMVRNKKAVICCTPWTVNGSSTLGTRMINNHIKLVLKAFNFECDVIISKVKYNNVESSKAKIDKSVKQIEKFMQNDDIHISQEYINLKVKELYLKYEYEVKVQEEKEEQKAIKERMKEEEKVMKEIEKAKEKIAKEEEHYHNELNRLKEQLESANEQMAKKIKDKMQEYEQRLEDLEEQKQDVFNREQNTRAGYVYVISNIGSFGENVYKIGMTRRLEPMDRINELSSASVPFRFDVHAMIFSEDAPTLENNLHKYFKDKQVNKVNYRKEFFNVTLDEIEEVVTKEFNGTVEFTKIAEAKEYRESLMMSATN